jgi:hypothetical protein
MSKWFFQFSPKTKFYPRSKKIESISSFPLTFVLWLLFRMTVTVAPDIGLSHVQTCWKDKKDPHFWYSTFSEFSFRIVVYGSNYLECSTWSRAEFQQPSPTSKTHNS